MSRTANPLKNKIVPAFKNQAELDTYNKNERTAKGLKILTVGMRDPRPGRDNKVIRRFRKILTIDEKNAQKMVKAAAAISNAVESNITSLLSASPTFAPLVQNRSAALYLRREAQVLANPETHAIKIEELKRRIDALNAAHDKAASVIEKIDNGIAGIQRVASALAGDISAAIMRNDSSMMPTAETVENLILDNVSENDVTFLKNLTDEFAELRADYEPADSDDDSENE